LGAEVVAEVVGGRRRKGGRLHSLTGEHARDVVIESAERTQEEEVVGAVRQHHPLPAACGHQIAG
jgi:hypothetical protein